MIVLSIAFLPVVIWAVLILGRGGFWLCRERDDAAFASLEGAGLTAADAPAIVAVMPARNEADVIAASVAALLKQDYPGRFSLIVIDDQSSDGTAAAARTAAARLGQDERLRIVNGSAPPKGWTGKLWAMRQGLEALDGDPPDFILFTDADIACAPPVLRRLATIARATDRVLVSVMAELRCVSRAERWLAPAFVFFFAKLYPFAWVNDPPRRTAAAAGGCMLVRREALAAAGGLEVLRGALIDDCALGAAMKRQGSVWLGLSHDVLSLRAHADVADFGRMITRSAFAQLRYSPLLLVGAVAGMGVTYLTAPAFAVFGQGAARAAGFVAWVMMVLAFAPMLRFYRQPVLFGLAMPLIAATYTLFTIESALQHWRGRGGYWKGRYQASAGGADGA